MQIYHDENKLHFNDDDDDDDDDTIKPPMRLNDVEAFIVNKHILNKHAMVLFIPNGHV